MQECNASALLAVARCVPKFRQRNIRPTCRECGAGEGHMHNRIGRRAAVAGVDRMAVEDVVASVLHFLPNEDAGVLQRVPAPNGTMCLVERCAFRGRQAITRATILRLTPAARCNAGVLPMRGQFVRCRP